MRASQPAAVSQEVATSLTLGLVAVVAFALIDVALYQQPTAQLRIALGGWGPQQYIVQRRDPVRFEKDWQNGVRAYDASIVMRLYAIADERFGISPDAAMAGYMTVELTFLLIAVAFLTQTLFSSPPVTILASALTLTCPLFGLNLGRFGYGLGAFPAELFYNLGHGFCLLGFAFCIRRMPIAAAASFGVAANIHMAMAALAVLFTAPFMITRPGIWRERRFWLASSLFAILMIPVALSFLDAGQSRAEGPTRDEWIGISKYLCFHWFPATLGVFGPIAHLEFVPSLLICGFFLHGIRPGDLKTPGTQFALMGAAMAVACVVIGIVASEVVPVPFLIRLCPQRITTFLTIVACLFASRSLFETMAAGPIGLAIVAGFVYVSMLTATPGVALVPIGILVLFDAIRERRLGPIPLSPWSQRLVAALIAATLLAAIGIGVGAWTALPEWLRLFSESMTNLWTPLRFLDPAGDGLDLLIRGGSPRPGIGAAAGIGFAMALVLIVRPRAILGHSANLLALGGLVAVVVSLVAWNRWSESQAWLEANGPRARAFLDMQTWCRDHTPTDAVFLVNPGDSYGWRDFSERSSFGVFREWAFTSFAYTTGRRSWAEANERMKLFDVDLPKTLVQADADGTPADVVRRQTRDRVVESFRRLDPVRLSRLRNDFGVEYVVAHRSALPYSPDGLDVVRENDEYVLYAIQAPRTN